MSERDKMYVLVMWTMVVAVVVIVTGFLLTVGNTIVGPDVVFLNMQNGTIVTLTGSGNVTVEATASNPFRFEGSVILQSEKMDDGHYAAKGQIELPATIQLTEGKFVVFHAHTIGDAKFQADAGQPSSVNFAIWFIVILFGVIVWLVISAEIAK